MHNMFYYKNEIIEIKKTICYFGTQFSRSSTFKFVVKEIKLSIAEVMSAVLSILYKFKLEVWEMKEKLLNTLLCRVLLYSIEIWGI